MNNILFDKDNVNYIDWEWACYSDPAQDISTLFYEDFVLPSWMIKLDGTELDFYLDSYLNHSKDEAIIPRVGVWKRYLHMIHCLYFEWKLRYFDETPQPSSREFYVDSLRVMKESLEKRCFLS